MAHLSWTNIFWYKQLLLSSTYWPFSLFKILKNSYCGSIVVRMRHLWVQNGSFAPNNFFLWKIINIILIYLLAPFFVQNLKKNSSFGSRVMRMRNFWAQNSPFPRMRIFFRKPVNEPCFFHSCLLKCQKSKSDINLLVKYWRLKNTEISLSESCNFIGYNLRTRFFPSMQFSQNVNEP